MSKKFKHIPIHKFITNAKLKLTLGGTFLAWFTGMLIACVVINLYAGLSGFLEVNKNNTNTDYNIIHKKIGLMNSLGVASSAFNNNEIEELIQNEAVLNVAPLNANTFKVGIDGGNMLKFYTELFLQAVPNEFLDVDTSGFKWKEGDVVPIVVANSFIDLYNHGFSVSQGLPQLPKSIIKKKTLDLKIRGNGMRTTIPCRIYDYSDRVSSILVPKSFLDWANDKYGTQTNKPAESLIVKSDASKGSILDKYFASKGYDYNKEMLNLDQTKQSIKAVIWFLIIVSIMVVILSVALSYFIAQTMLYEKMEMVKHLFWQGYTPPHLLNSLYKPILYFGVLASILTFIVAFFINSWVSLKMKTFNFEISSLTFSFIIFWVIISVVSLSLIKIKIKKNIYKILR